MVLSHMREYRHYVYGGAGAACIALGTALLYYYMTVYRFLLYQQLKLTDGSMSFNIWRDTPVPQQMNFYLYNWTNPEELGKKKPSLTQIGPYCFNVIERKSNITWNNNGTITFKIKRTWFFDEENSNGSLNDTVTSMNAVAMSAANAVRHKEKFIRAGLKLTLWTTQQKIAITHTVGELLFFGYSDKLLDIATQLPAFEGIELPPYDKFGWFYKRNGSDEFEGTFEMETGVNDIYSFGVLRNWNFKRATGFYDLPCGYVNGSAGELFPPEQKKTKLEMFSADLCRSISLNYQKEVEVLGVKGYKFVGDKYTFDNGSLDPSNKCFCDGECAPSGVLNVTSCRYGSPGFVSFPNFYLGDKYYMEQVEGIEPNPEAHEMYIIIEPNTGIPLDVAARFQINIKLSSVEDIAPFENVSTIYFPMLWFEQKASITEDLVMQVKLALYLPLIIQCLGGFVLFTGLVLVLVVIYLAVQPNDRADMTEMKLTGGAVEPLIQNGSSRVIISNQKPSSDTRT